MTVATGKLITANHNISHTGTYVSNIAVFVLQTPYLESPLSPEHCADYVTTVRRTILHKFYISLVLVLDISLYYFLLPWLCVCVREKINQSYLWGEKYWPLNYIRTGYTNHPITMCFYQFYYRLLRCFFLLVALPQQKQVVITYSTNGKSDHIMLTYHYSLVYVKFLHFPPHTLLLLFIGFFFIF
jgi:hypothetical protein